MPGFPKVTILFSDGNLLKEISAIDGIAGIVGSVNTAELIGVPKTVFNLTDAIAQGFTEADEPFMYRQLSEFYASVAGNQELHVMGVADTMTMTQMLDKDDPDGAVKLLAAAQGKVRLLGVCRRPDAGYDPGNDFIDGDVQSALTKSLTFGTDQNAKYNYLRILIEGRVADGNSTEIFSPVTAESDYAGVVLGGSVNDGSASIGLALGRAVIYGAHIKIGKVANGSLPIDQAYIGAKKIEEIPGLESLHESGYISFMNHPTKAGYFFGIDRMANTGDYRRLAFGRVIDKAAVITLATYVEEIEDEVDVDDSGKISELDVKHLEGRLEQQVIAGMGNQISGFEVYINPDQDIIETSKLAVKARVRPKGYNSFIEVDLGLTA
jgi:hypothetical protein